MIDKVGTNCCGCGACKCICPKSCITMESNIDGFLYPIVDKVKCVGCGMCVKSCPVLNEHSTDDLQEAWGCSARNRELLLNSSSGGVFSLLAEKVLEQGGLVYGAAFTEDFYRVRHIAVEEVGNLDKLRGSKYLQSYSGDIFREIREKLTEGKKILFSGTPCQVAGLKCFLGKDFDNLLCLDIICHGTPSPLFWEKYLCYLESKMSSKAVAVNFRSKENGWHLFNLSIQMNNGHHYLKSMHEDPYMRIFLQNYCLRESCYQCTFKEKGPFSDITIGDFWGVEKVLPEMDNPWGTSLSIIHTKKGKALFQSIKLETEKTEVDIREALISNEMYYASVKRPQERDVFFTDLMRKPVPIVLKKYTRKKLILRIRKMADRFRLGKQ